MLHEEVDVDEMEYELDSSIAWWKHVIKEKEKASMRAKLDLEINNS